MEDLQLIKKVKEEGDNDSILELIERHSGIYNTVIDNHLSGDKNKLDHADFMENRSLAIYNCAISYDPEKKAKFPTYLANKTRWDCLNFLKKRKKMPTSNLENLDMAKIIPNYLEPRIDLDPENVEIILLFEKFVNENCSEKTRKVVDLRYNNYDNRLRPWIEVAKEAGMSIQGVVNIFKKCISEFKQEKEYV